MAITNDSLKYWNVLQHATSLFRKDSLPAGFSLKNSISNLWKTWALPSCVWSREPCICWGSSNSYSPMFLNDAYNPSRERKSGMPQDTPTSMTKKLDEDKNNTNNDWLIPAPVNTRIRRDWRIKCTASSIVLRCGNFSRFLCYSCANHPRGIARVNDSHTTHSNAEKVEHRLRFSVLQLGTLHWVFIRKRETDNSFRSLQTNSTPRASKSFGIGMFRVVTYSVTKSEGPNAVFMFIRQHGRRQHVNADRVPWGDVSLFLCPASTMDSQLQIE